MKKLDIGNPPSKISHIKAKLKKRSFWEPALLILLLLFVLGSVIGFALFDSTKQVSAESSNAKMISELNDINSYLNELNEDVTNNQKSLASVTENNSNSLKEEVYNTKEGNYLNISRMEVQDYKFVEEEGKVITIPNGYRIVDYTKSDAGMRAVYMNSEARRLFELIREVNEKNGYKDGDFVFVSSQKKTRGNARTITTYLEKLCVVTGIINKSNHKIRKTYISSLFDKGINIDTIRAQAGHEDERTSLNNYCFDQSDLEILEALLENAKNTTTTYSCVAN